MVAPPISKAMIFRVSSFAAKASDRCTPMGVGMISLATAGFTMA